jgi:hypothetical protein
VRLLVVLGNIKAFAVIKLKLCSPAWLRTDRDKVKALRRGSVCGISNQPP